ncbi:hypothetical protein SAMN06265795_10844 [Noviherbaspirillum humi]|uniref:Uncharacterized protein n=1 Tax=Noviherbaspirillum humi TaxID=1688639 RepID=A0A239I0N7_9BURK|nr:hypothetical protein [Noviherbaspirillum humi]SNS86982.1 hypothetical protein SAMN06265795_10844 [Noviherbaspirillum humi]
MVKRTDFPGLELEVDPRQQRLEGVVERVAWVVLAAFLMAIAFGLFGRGGPLSDSEAVSADRDIGIEYQRFVRHHTSDTLRIRVDAKADTVRLKVSADYLRRIQIEQVTPPPQRVVMEKGALVYEFNARPGSIHDITFDFMPEGIGSLPGWIALEGRSRLSFEQFVYP